MDDLCGFIDLFMSWFNAICGIPKIKYLWIIQQIEL